LKELLPTSTVSYPSENQVSCFVFVIFYCQSGPGAKRPKYAAMRIYLDDDPMRDVSNDVSVGVVVVKEPVDGSRWWSGGHVTS